MRKLADKVIQSRAGGHVERCHGIPHQGSYSNAAHSWGVAMLLHYLWPEDFARLALICLAHDVPEAWVGDIPAPTGRYVPGLRDSLQQIEGDLNRSMGLPGEDELNETDLAKVKACDRLEFYIWCREQVMIGNRYAEESQIEIERYFVEVRLPSRAEELYEALQGIDVLPRQANVMKEICDAMVEDIKREKGIV